MRVLTLNLRHGGGRRVADLARSIVGHNADVVALTEFRTNEAGSQISQALDSAGYIHLAHSNPSPKTNGVLIASRLPMESNIPEIPARQRLLEVAIGELTIAGVYFPGKRPKLQFWSDEFMPLAVRRVSRPYMFIGDFNTGKHRVDEEGASFFGADYMDRMEELGWTDAWRSIHGSRREYTWFSYVGNGFRCDHAWLSPSLRPRLRGATHSHREREQKMTDHSALLIELA